MWQTQDSLLSLHATDTDSFIFSVEYPVGSNRNFFRELFDISDSLDLSTYDAQSPLVLANEDRKELVLRRIKESKGRVGLMKNELSGHLDMLHIIALRPKLYAFQVSNSTEKLVCKGIQRYVVKDHMSFDSYKQVLINELPTRHSMNQIRSTHHTLYIQRITKTSLSLFDDKRYWLNKKISVPHGHPLAVVDV